MSNRIGRCYNLNCKGYVHMFKTQLICDKCNSIFCRWCLKKIYPKKIEDYDLNNFNFIEIDNPKYILYSSSQLKDNYNHYHNVFLCPNCDASIFYNNLSNKYYCYNCNNYVNNNSIIIN